MCNNQRLIHRIISVIIIVSLVMSLFSCSKRQSQEGHNQKDSPTINEKVIKEEIISEDRVNECITPEIYLEEITVAENKISEMLLEEETIEEILVCKTIYVPQDHIKEFSKNSQTAKLFGNDVNLLPVLKKVAVGTGVIVTLVILKRHNIQGPIASIVVAAADESLQFAKNGAAIGTLFGGFTGATSSIDKSGRITAVAGFAATVVGLIVATISLVAVIPSGGSTTVTLAAGIKIIIAGVEFITAATGTIASGASVIKTFTSTDGFDIDWDNINWKELGVDTAQKAINNGADGYMWGSIIGAVNGGAKGYDFYQKFNTPYTKYNDRLMQTPKDGPRGKWSGKRGESDYILNEPIELPNGEKITKVTYKNAVPDFSPFQKAQVKIPNMTNDRSSNFEQADKLLAEYWSKIKYNNKKWTSQDVYEYRKVNKMSWHEMSNMESMQLVPSEVNQKFTHYGGVAEYNAMIGKEGTNGFD